MIDIVSNLGATTLSRLRDMGFGLRYFLRLCWLSLLSLRRPRLIAEQVHFVGNHSLRIIAVSGLFIGFVLGLQGYNTLQRYGSEEAVGLLVALSLVRELGPVITALLFAGRAGTSLTAGIGLMKSGEQFAAMEMMAVDPMLRVIAPRFVATLISLPLLAAIFSAIGLFGGWLVTVQMLGVDPGSYWTNLRYGVDIRYDVLNGFIKSVVFAMICGFVAVVVGHESKPTPEGVSRATTTSVVVSSIAVLASDFLLTAIMFAGV